MAEYKSEYTGAQIDAGIGKANTALQTIADESITPEKTTFVKEPEYTNLANPQDAQWLTNYKFDGKSIKELSAGEPEGCIVSNVITVPAIPGDEPIIVRVKGMDVSDAGSRRQKFKLACVKSDGSLTNDEPSPVQLAVGGTSSNTYVKDTLIQSELEEGIYAYTLYIMSNNTQNTLADGYTHIRIAGYPLDGNANNVIITVNEKIETYDTPYILTENVSVPLAVSNEKRIEALEEKTTNVDNAEFFLPEEAVAVVGVEFNMYKKNIFFSSRSIDNYDITWKFEENNAPSLLNFREWLRITPTNGDVGTWHLTMKALDIKTGELCVSKTITLNIIEDTAVSAKNVLFLGDSLTASRGGLYAAQIQHVLSNGGISSIGTQEGSSEVNLVGTVYHEGYNGAAASGFSSEYVTSGNLNPFYNPTSQTFDLSYYLTNHPSFAIPDIVCINLGANMLGNNPGAIEGINKIIKGVRAYSSTIPIMISLAVGLSGQDAWRDSTYTSDQMKGYWRSLLNVYKENYGTGSVTIDGTTYGNLYFSTPYLNVDPDFDYPTTEILRCSRGDATIVIQNDKMHPDRTGNLKMADSYYANLLNLLR